MATNETANTDCDSNTDENVQCHLPETAHSLTHSLFANRLNGVIKASKKTYTKKETRPTDKELKIIE